METRGEKVITAIVFGGMLLLWALAILLWGMSL
jgi:hypothetical protein